MTEERRIRVLVIDDSAVVRQVVGEMLERDRSIEVCGLAADPILAMTKMRGNWPDVILLDIEMPRMDGITFLRKVMAERPTPVVICSTLTEKGAETTFQALSAGAVTIITKPKLGLRSFLEDAANDLVAAVKAAASANMQANVQTNRQPLKGRAQALPSVAPKLSADAILSGAPVRSRALAETTERVVAIGTSTGGTQALETVLTGLPRVSPAIVIVQHMPEQFTAAFAERLDQLCEIEVKEAANDDRVLPGRALIAPGGRHLLLKRSGAYYYVEVKDGPLVNRHRPSVDVLFRSVAQAAGKNALGIIMTGMGDDGARGLKELRTTGAHTIAQDERSCVVFGMPKEAIKLGAAEEILPLADIAAAIARLA
jgi:two-component system chemotaxis response regulator CheB